MTERYCICPIKSPVHTDRRYKYKAKGKELTVITCGRHLSWAIREVWWQDGNDIRVEVML